MKKDTVLLPNLLFEKNNVYFKFKKCFELNVNNKQILFDKFLLNDISLNGVIYFEKIKINCSIIKKENTNGLLMEFKYDKDDYFSKLDIQKVSKKIEKMILNISDSYSEYDQNENELDNKNNKSHDYHNDNYSSNNSDLNDSYCDYYSSNNYNNDYPYTESDEIYDENLDDTYEEHHEHNNFTFSKFNST